MTLTTPKQPIFDILYRLSCLHTFIVSGDRDVTTLLKVASASPQMANYPWNEHG